MTGHLSSEQLAAYRGRTLAPAELVAADFHLAICDECRRTLASPEMDAALLRGIGAAKQQHLSYEQMEGYADGTLGPTEKEFVIAHAGLCTRCARELREFAAFIPVMDAPVEPRPKKEKQRNAGFWQGFAASFGGRQWALAGTAAAAVVLAILIVPRMVKPRLDALAEGQLSALPPAVRADVSQIVEAQTGVRPASLAHLAVPAKTSLSSPLGFVVPEQSPILRWGPVRGTKIVTVFKSDGTRVAGSGDLAEASEWQVSIPLERGGVYRWRLEANDLLIGEGEFAVLSESDSRDWVEAQARYSGSHLLLGAMAQHLGMLDEAQREFVALRLEMPQSETVARLLRNLEAIRGQ